MTTTSEPGTSWMVLMRLIIAVSAELELRTASTTDTGGICDANVDNAPANMCCGFTPEQASKSTALRARLSMSIF
jgi:hypothetical protein